jgi:hypothetical protein
MGAELLVIENELLGYPPVQGFDRGDKAWTRRESRGWSFISALDRTRWVSHPAARPSAARDANSGIVRGGKGAP